MATIKKISGLSDAGTLTTTHRLLVEDSSGNLKSTTVGAVNTHTHTWSEVTGKPSTFTPASHTQGEATLTWGGKNFSGTYGPVDASMIPELGANRLAFGKPAGITIEYSRDGGSTWTDYGADNNSKVNLFSPPGAGFSIGKADSNNKATANYLLRVTINTSSFGVYTALNKFMIYCSTNGSTGSYCSIDAALESTPTTFVNFANKVPISGWSGYNIINTSSITTYGNSASNQYGRLRFTFGCTGGSTTYSGLNIVKIYGFGGVGWTAPSNLARTGHIYSIGTGQSVVFPGSVTANGGFAGSLNGTASKATNDSAGHQITTTYIKGLSVSGKTITYTKGDDSTGNITTQDTTYSSKTAASGGTDVSLVTTGEKYTWNNKANAFTVTNGGNTASWGNSVTVGTVAGTALTFKMPANPNTDTHYTAKNVVASKSTGTANVTAATSNPYLNLIENGAVRSTHQIKGNGATKVKTDTSGNIVISSIDTHYTATPVLGATGAVVNATSSVSDPYLNIVENGDKSGGIQIKGSGATSVSAINGIITISSTDTNTTYSSKTAANGGTDVSLVTTGEKYTWNNKANAFTVSSTNPTAAWSSPVVVGTVAGTELKFTMPASPSIEAKISSEDTNSRIFLVGATSQSSSGANTYSDDQVYATNGQLDANKVRVAEKVTLQYNSSTESLDFVFI